MKVAGEALLAALQKPDTVVPRLLLLTGPEVYLKERIVERLAARVVAEGSESFNISKLRGSEIRWAEVVAAARTYPMMSDGRLVVLSSIGDVRDKSTDAMVEYVKDPSASTCVVVDADGGDQRRQPLLAIARAATVVACEGLRPRDAESFAQAEARRIGVKMDRGAAALLVERIGNDMIWIVGEVGRLALLVHPESTIATADVERAVGRSRQLSVFEYVGALSRRDLAAAVLRLRDLVADGEAPLGILALIERQFRMMLAAAEAQARGASARDACQQAGVPGFIVSRFLQELRAWSPAALRAAHPLFLKKDQDMKSRGVSPLTELELLTAELLTL